MHVQRDAICDRWSIIGHWKHPNGGPKRTETLGNRAPCHCFCPLCTSINPNKCNGTDNIFHIHEFSIWSPRLSVVINYFCEQHQEKNPTDRTYISVFAWTNLCTRRSRQQLGWSLNPVQKHVRERWKWTRRLSSVMGSYTNIARIRGREDELGSLYLRKAMTENRSIQNACICLSKFIREWTQMFTS